jgi:hypothetical protein
MIDVHVKTNLHARSNRTKQINAVTKHANNVRIYSMPTPADAGARDSMGLHGAVAHVPFLVRIDVLRVRRGNCDSLGVWF